MTEKGEGARIPQRELSDIVSPSFLKMISEASGNFSFVVDDRLRGDAGMGHTDMQARTIHINPDFFHGSEERGITPMKDQQIEGFLYHEAGHHQPDVLAFDNAMTAKLKNIPIPSVYKLPERQAEFTKAYDRTFNNAVIDIVDEAVMGRKPYYLLRDAIDALNHEAEVPDLTNMGKPMQFLQSLLRMRYKPTAEFEGKVDQEVYQALQEANETGSLEILEETRALANPFGTAEGKRKAIDRKVAISQSVLSPLFLKLIADEIEERKKEKQKSGNKQEQGKRSRKGDGSETIFAEEEERQQQIAQEVLEELLKEGEKMQPLAPSEEQTESHNKAINEVKMKAEQQAAGQEKNEAEGESGGEQKKDKGDPQEALRRAADKMLREAKENSQRGLADAMKVRLESVTTWNRIKDEYQETIAFMANKLSEIFIDDRRKKIKYLVREGEIVPGLEHETIAAFLSGELDPDTRFQTEQNPEFLETELEFIVDTSGSMSGKPLESAIDAMVVITEAFKLTQETLSDNKLLRQNEQPFRIGVTTFSATPQRVTPLSEPLSDEKELTIIDKTAQVGGGTDETKALKGTYKEMTEGLSSGNNNVIKIIMLLTDGQGNQAGVAPIIRQIENDNQIALLVLGLGLHGDGQDIIDSYIGPLKDKENSNVYGIVADSVDKILPEMVKFLPRQIEEKAYAS